MTAYYNQRCPLCGQFVADSDREAMLEATTWEWDEALVDEALVDRHVCVDQDPHGARQWARLADAGEMVPELRWILQAALEHRQAAPVAAWVVFTGPAASIAMVPERFGAVLCWLASGAVRAAAGRARGRLLAGEVGRPPP